MHVPLVFGASLICLAHASSKPEQSTDRTIAIAPSQNIVSGRSRFKMVDGYEYSILRHNCWAISGSNEEADDSPIVNIGPDSQCPKDQQGSWSMEIQHASPSVSLEESWRLHKLSPRYPIHFDKTIRVGDRNSVIFNEVTPEAKVIDRKDQTNYFWTVETRCGNSNIKLLYVDYLDKAAREKARKRPSIPSVFQNLIDGFQCERP